MAYLINIPKLATIFAHDVHLLENWNQFVGLLFTSIPPEAVSWRNGFKSGIINAYDLFSNILEEWASRKGKMATIEILQKLLRKGEFNRAADSLDPLQNLEITISNNEVFPPLPKCIKNFVGRKTELRLLQNNFDRGEFLQVITGTNGTGKSTLALKFSFQVQKDKGFQVLWLSKEDCRRFHIFKQFKFKKPMLLVLDDVEPNNKSILEILTTLRDFGTGHCVLITTTQAPTKLVGSRHLEIIPLFNLEQEDAINFLSANLNPQSISTEESLRKLIELTGGLPLTLQQAVTYINQQSLEELTVYTVDHYISDLSSGSPNRTRKLLDQPLSPLEHPKHSWNRTTFGTWKECLRKVAGVGVEGRQAIRLLRILALINLKRVRIEAIKLIVCTQMLRTSQDAEKLKINCMTQTPVVNCLKILKQNYLIHVENDNVSVHPMLRQVTLLKVNNKRALISSLLGHIQLNLLTSQFNKADVEIMACWATALSLKDLELTQNYLEVGLCCVSHPDCPLTLTKNTLEFILQTEEDECSDRVIQIKLAYFSKLGSEGISSLESLLAQIGNSHRLAVNGKEALAAAYKAVGNYPQYICIVRELLDSCVDCDYGLFGLGEEEMRRMRDFGELAAEQNELQLALHYFLCVYVWIKVREDFDLELDLQFWNKEQLLGKIKKLSEEEDFNCNLLPAAEQFVFSINDRKPKVKRKWNVRFIIRYLGKNCSRFKRLDFIKIIKELKLELLPHR